VRFDVLHRNLADARRVLAAHRQITGRSGSAPSGRLPKIVADALCIVARGLRHNSLDYVFIPHPDAERLTPQALLDIALEHHESCEQG
jgi:hypothetical protein